MACESSATSTVFETTTLTSLVATVTGSTTYVVVDPNALSLSTTFLTVRGEIIPTRITVTGATVTTTQALTGTSTSLLVTSTPISTLFASCTASSTTTSSSTTSTTSTSSSTTSSSTTTTPSSTPSSTASTLTSTSGRSTITEITTVPAPSSSASSSSSATSSAVGAPSSGSPTNLGAIIGGAVGGGVGGLILLLGLFLWFCCYRKSGSNHRQRDAFDFKGDRAWDPAQGVASAAVAGGAAGRRQSNGPNGMDGGKGRTMSRRYVGEGAAAAFAGGVSAYDREKPDEPFGGGGGAGGKKKRFKPADEQDAYYANAPPVPSREDSATSESAGLAGVGIGHTMGRGGSNHSGGSGGAERSNSQGRASAPGPYASMLAATTFDPRARDGGWAVANDLHGVQSQAQQQPLQPQSSNGNLVRQQQLQPSYPPGAAAGYASDDLPYEAEQRRLNRPPSFASRKPVPPVSQAPPPPAPLPLPGSIDYHPPSPQDYPPADPRSLAPPSSGRFDPYGGPSARSTPRSLPGFSSPVPSHRSIPALGAIAQTDNSPDRPEGRLRVMNHGPASDFYQSEGDVEELRRFGGRADTMDPYGGLEDGLDRASAYVPRN
ncbi:hypothetical protein JCM21900_005376 [Sporobolomyces salmonicolor]